MVVEEVDLLVVGLETYDPLGYDLEQGLNLTAINVQLHPTRSKYTNTLVPVYASTPSNYSSC